MGLGVILTFLLGLYNLYYRGPSMNMAERGQYLKSINESVELANNRALEAEQRALAAEAQLALCEDSKEILQGKLSYLLTFEVMLGEKPDVKNVTIVKFTDRK